MRRKYTDDSKAPVADTQPFANCLVPGKKFTFYLGANDADRLRVVRVAFGQEDALAKGHLPHHDEIRGRAQYRRRTIARIPMHIAGTDDQWCDMTHVAATQQRLRIVDREIARGFADQKTGRATGRFGSSRQHD